MQMPNLNRIEIAKGVHFSAFSDPRYKTNRISINFITTLSEESAALGALIPNLLKQSNAKYPDFTALNKRLSELYGASLSGYVRRLGDSQALCLAIESIDNAFALEGEDITAELCAILADCLFMPVIENDRFSEKTFALEKQNLIDDIEAEINEKRTYAIRRAEAITCAGEPYGVGRYGSKQSAEAITQEAVMRAYRAMLQSAKAEVLCVGCGNFDATRELLTGRFNQAGRGDTAPYRSDLSPAHASVSHTTERMAIKQSKLVLAFKSDYTNVFANSLMINLYGGTATSKLFLNVRERLSLCYYCAARFDRDKGVMLVDSGVENENIEKARDEILKQLDAVKAGDFTQEEIDRARLELLTHLRGIGDKTAQVENWYLQRIYSGRIITPEEYERELMQVTAADITASAKAMALDTVYVLTSEEAGK